MSYWVKVVELPGMCNNTLVGPTERDGEDPSCFRLDPWEKDDLDKHYCKFCSCWESKQE